MYLMCTGQIIMGAFYRISHILINVIDYDSVYNQFTYSHNRSIVNTYYICTCYNNLNCCYTNYATCWTVLCLSSVT